MSSTQPDVAAVMRVKLAYLWRHGRLPDLSDPCLFTEIVQLRKLYDRDPRMPVMADKVAVKQVVARLLGKEWVVPLLWSGEWLPPACVWTAPVILKARHGCNQNIVITPGSENWAAISRKSQGWMLKRYGALLDEWLYSQIPRGLLVEPFIGQPPALPVDYKIYVFDGQATHVQVHLDRAGDHRWILHDVTWKAVSAAAPQLPRPSALPAMLRAAETIAGGFSFARVDFYQPGDQPLFGEITFYPGSGLDPFHPMNLDEELGALWLHALRTREVVRSRARWRQALSPLEPASDHA